MSDFVETATLVSAFATAMSVCRCGDVFSASGKPGHVNRKQKAWQEKHRDCVEVKREGEKAFWLSFCDAERPEGQQFLGVCIVKVSAEDADAEALTLLLRFPPAQPGSEWLAAAITKSHRLGCNPGGEVAAHELPADHPNLAFYELGVLMDRRTIEEIDRRIKT
jgi:hypothetical protein